MSTRSALGNSSRQISVRVRVLVDDELLYVRMRVRYFQADNYMKPRGVERVCTQRAGRLMQTHTCGVRV